MIELTHHNLNSNKFYLKDKGNRFLSTIVFIEYRKIRARTPLYNYFYLIFRLRSVLLVLISNTEICS